MRIVQMTSVHSWQDTRVFIKMCSTVAAKGHEVHLVVPRDEGPPTEIVKGVTIHAVPVSSNRRDRMMGTVSRVLEVARSLDGDIYQFHDPEFLMQAVGFQNKTGKPVVFDSHEDYRLAMMYKPYLPGWVRPAVGQLFGLVEDRTVNKLAAVVAATPSIAERFQGHKNCIVIQNFPMKDEFDMEGIDLSGRQPHLAGYVGSLAKVRGALEMVQALETAGPDLRLDLGGTWAPEKLRDVCASQPGWSQVNELGFMNRQEIQSHHLIIKWQLE